MDSRNAFNTISRNAIFRAVLEFFPSLLAFTRTCYDSPPVLSYRVDDVVHRFLSEEGTQQGDPLGPFYHAVAAHPTWCIVQIRHPGVVILAYLDDVHILSPPVLAAAAYTDLVQSLQSDLGLEGQICKCAVYSPEGDCTVFPAARPGVPACTCECMGGDTYTS